MAGPKFVHLHVHSHYSLLDGATRIESLVARAKEHGSPAVALTDHGNLFGAVEFYQAAVKAGVKPLVGCEIYVAPADRRDRETKRFNQTYFHLLLLAMNHEGYRNLLKLTSRAFREGFYYRPRVDKGLLREHSEGLICTTTCLAGEVPKALLAKDHRAAEEVAKEYLEIFGPDRFFIEIQDHGLDDQKVTNPELATIAKRLGVGLVATNDVHYLEHDDHYAHDVLCCINTGAKLEDRERFRFDNDQFFFKSPEQMGAIFADFPEAIENTARIAGMCNLEMDFSKVYAPVFRPPGERTPEDYLRERVYEGARRRYGEISDELRERIDYELGVIGRKGFSSYFLIVWDVVEFARRHGIPATARGSACSSVVGYCLGISAPDPLRYGLYFERFMDPDRDERPDVDLDICQERRPEIIDYVRRTYGHVAQIITFGTLKAKAAVKDVSRVMGMDFHEANRLTQLIPGELKMTIDRALETEPELKKRYTQDETVRKVIDVARRLEGLARHAGVHAAGVVIAQQPLDDLIPLYRPEKPENAEQIVTQFDGTTVEKVGLLKMDFLGLVTLTLLERARQLVKKNHGVEVDFETLDLTDPKVFELFARGETKGIFQFESGGMRDVVMKMKPNRIEDLIAANALFRPGPMVNIEAYIARKHGERWSTPHPIMTEVLAETYGIMVYQEQVSRLVHRLGGIELKRAFRLAKAISKKKTQMIDAEREPFLAGAVANGVPEATAREIFEDILRFGGYAFNKAHSTGYAIVAFQTAFLKAYYPVEFMAALLTSEEDDSDKLADYLEECRRMGIAVKPPDINTSELDFTVVPDARGQPAIRFGLGGIKGVGEKAVASILEARKAGPFRSLFDFCERVDLQVCNKGLIEALIKCGAFDSTGAMRKGLLAVLDRAMQSGAQAQADRQSGQMLFFGAGAAESGPEPAIPRDEWTEAEMLAHEKAVLGFYVTAHPLSQHAAQIRKYATVRTIDLARRRDGETVTLGGMITKLRTVVTKSGRNAGSKMGILTIEDLSGQIEGVLFPKTLQEFLPWIAPDRVAFFRGEVDRRREEPSLRVNDIIPIEDSDRVLASAVLLRIRSSPENVATLEKLRDTLGRHRGDKPVYLELLTGGALRVTVRCNGGVAVDPSPDCLRELSDLLGDDAVVVMGPTLRAEAPAATDAEAGDEGETGDSPDAEYAYPHADEAM